MKIGQFSLYMLGKEKRKAFFYTLTCIFSVMATFLFINMIYNEALYGGLHINNYGQANKILPVMISFLTTVLIVAVNFFAYNFYLNSQTKEIGIFMLGGTKSFRIFKYLFVQNLVIFGIALVVGLPLGALLIPLTNLYMGKLSSIDIPLFNYSSTAFFATIAIMLLTLIYLAIVATGFIYRNEIKELIGMQKEMKKKDGRMLDLPAMLYTILLFMPVLMIIFIREPEITAVMSFIAVLGGFKGFCRYVVPKWILKLQRRYLITHKLGLISSANFHQLLVQGCSIMQIFLIICIFMNTYMINNVDNPTYLAVISVSYIMLTISVAMAMGYKILLETNHREITFKHLYKLGYTKNELSQIIRQEMLALFGFVLGILVVYIGATYLPYVLLGKMSIWFMLWNMGIFIIALIVVGIYGYRTYQKTMLKGMR